MPLKTVKSALRKTPELVWYATTAALVTFGMAIFFNPYFETQSTTAGMVAVMSWLAAATLKVALAVLVLDRHRTLGEVAVIGAIVWLIMATIVSPPHAIEIIVLTGEQTWGVAGRELTHAMILLVIFIGLGDQATTRRERED